MNSIFLPVHIGKKDGGRSQRSSFGNIYTHYVQSFLVIGFCGLNMEVFSCLLRVVFSLLCIFCMSMVMVNDLVTANDFDRLSLLAFKAGIHDPLGTLNSWNHSLHFCEWKGVKCSRRHLNRVTVLDLRSQSLEGSISPHIGNLSFLKRLILANNSFNGEIPQQIGRLFRLQHLSLAFNLLEGQIPQNISHCINLIDLRLYSNKLEGRIPDELGFLSKLTTLALQENNLSGKIPPSLGNLSSANVLWLSENNLEGSIPSHLSHLTSLKVLILHINNLSGTVPPSLYNLSSLVNVSLSMNQLQGSIPPDIGFTLPNLWEFSISSNNFSGSISSSFSNCSRLERLQLDGNNFVGSVPNNLGELKSLKWLGLYENSLGSGHADDLNFLISLTNCTSLEVLDMTNNKFGGMLPNSVANLSTKLTTFIIGRNQIYGSIPTGFQNLVSLNRLGLEKNMFTGSIPIDIGKLQNLRWLTVGWNKLSGRIPSSFGNLTQLILLSLNNNYFIGGIPSTLGKCTSMQSLYLNNNKLSGTIPKQVISLSSLSIILNLSNNSLSGSLPTEVRNLKQLTELYISRNKLSGEIPSTLSECSSLGVLQMQENFFQGKIPSSLSSMKGLQYLSLAHNNLSGKIPKDLEKLGFLSLNLSFNNLEGEVPRDGIFKNLSAISVSGNSMLCGGVPELQLPNCHIQLNHKKQWKLMPLKVIIIIVAIGVLLLFSIVVFFALYWRKKLKPKLPSTIYDIGYRYLEISYNELLKATNGFGSTNLLGAGSFGSVYKGILHEDEKTIAVKVLNLQQRGATKSFMAECDALRKVRHRNLLKIITCCSGTDFQGNDFKALVFEFMANGSLDNWLHPTSNVDDYKLQWRNLSFEQRLNIAIDVASALDYLHHHCQIPIVHCDLKPSNVLLDDDLIAHVGDFGLAKFLSRPFNNSGQNDQTNSSIAIRGSIGYIPPEYGIGGKVSTQGDVYSYGILLLEMFTGKRPINGIFIDGLSLHNFCKMALPLRVLEIVDSCLILEAENGDGDDHGVTNHNMEMNRINHIRREKMREILVSIIQIGVVCSSELPSDRISMNDVIEKLQVVKDLFIRVVM